MWRVLSPSSPPPCIGVSRHHFFYGLHWLNSVSRCGDSSSEATFTVVHENLGFRSIFLGVLDERACTMHGGHTLKGNRVASIHRRGPLYSDRMRAHLLLHASCQETRSGCNGGGRGVVLSRTTSRWPKTMVRYGRRRPEHRLSDSLTCAESEKIGENSGVQVASASGT